MPGRLGTPPPMPAPTDEWHVTITACTGGGWEMKASEAGSGVEGVAYAITRAGARRRAARYIRAKRRARARGSERFTVAPEDSV